MDDEFEEEMKQKYFQFVIFDDEVDIEDDVVGIAKYFMLYVEPT